VLEIIDASGRTIRLTRERWSHITEEHPEVASYVNDFPEILLHPTKITHYEYDDKVHYYYKYYKNRALSTKYLLIIVKYLNGEGFIITAYFVRNIW